MTMMQISDHAKFQFKKAGILTILFLALFFLGFYVVNLLDIKPAPKQALKLNSTQSVELSEELKKRIGADGISIAEFQDWAKINDLKGENIYDGDPDKDNLVNSLEYLHGTDPNNADTDGDKYTDYEEIINGYDPDAFGDIKTSVLVNIEKIGVSAPMIWSKSVVEKDSLKDLESGLSHFPQSGIPGENGNMIISGHSSNYVWAKGDYNYIFKNLNDLEAGDMVTIKTVQKNGRIIVFKYKITEKFVTTPDDERIFIESKNPILTLSTCWPLGTNLKRLIVRAELIKA
jgi:LPXTG-site transpeptidase (sortase) family protein